MREGPEWRELLEEQCGLVTAAQAEQHGWSKHAVRAQVSAGRWTRRARGVYATFNGALDYEQKVWLGILYAGADAVASHETALWLVDRKRPTPTIVHVTVPRSRNSRRTRVAVIHRSDCDELDVQPDACPPRMRVERAALDCAAAARNDDAAIAVLAGVVQQRLTTAPRLGAVLARCPTLPRRALLADVLVMCGDGAESLLEVRHEQIRRGHGLPVPRRQSRHGKARVDVDYDGLIIELDGRAGNLEVGSWWKDMLRDDLHTAVGRAVMRFPGFLLLTKPHVVAHLEAAALRLRGWTGELCCPPGCPGLPELDEGEAGEVSPVIAGTTSPAPREAPRGPADCRT